MKLRHNMPIKEEMESFRQCEWQLRDKFGIELIESVPNCYADDGSVKFWYKNIRFQNFSKSDLLDFAFLLESFTLNHYQPEVVKKVSEFLTLESVQLDGEPSVLVKIEYIDEIAGDKTYLLEVFLDLGDAHVISKTILHILNTSKSYVISSF